MISREQLVTQSVEDYVRAALTARGYDDKVDFTDAFPYTLEEPPTRPLIAAGFDFDDPGEQAEMGSDLTLRPYGIEWWVFDGDADRARNVAHIIKFALEADGSIPVKDYGAVGEPVVGYLQVDGSSAARQAFADPEPWQENVWQTTVRVIDEYFANQV